MKRPEQPARRKKKPAVYGHPWAEFLYARANVLRWLRDEFHETPEQIVAHLAMDPVQVQLILATPLEELVQPARGGRRGR